MPKRLQIVLLNTLLQKTCLLHTNICLYDLLHNYSHVCRTMSLKRNWVKKNCITLRKTFTWNMNIYFPIDLKLLHDPRGTVNVMLVQSSFLPNLIPKCCSTHWILPSSLSKCLSFTDTEHKLEQMGLTAHTDAELEDEESTPVIPVDSPGSNSADMTPVGQTPGTVSLHSDLSTQFFLIQIFQPFKGDFIFLPKVIIILGLSSWCGWNKSNLLFSMLTNFYSMFPMFPIFCGNG